MIEISVTHNDVTYLATYEVVGDTLVVSLPDGSIRHTELRGLHPESAAVHLK